MNKPSFRFRETLREHARVLACVGALIAIVGCASRQPAPVLIHRQITPSPTKAPQDGLSLKVVTYNIWGLPSWMTGARGGRYPRIARELERLDPDIVLLQEAWTSRARKAAPPSGRWAFARAAGQHTFFQQSGMMTLSKFPILGGAFYPFHHAALPDRLVNKGALKVSVRMLDGTVLNVWNVHLQNGGSAKVRRSQIRELISHVEAADDGQVADLVGGDFNCTPDSCLFRELDRSLGPAVQELGSTGPSVTWDGLARDGSPGKTLDYIFIRTRSNILNPKAAQHVVFAADSLDHRLSDHFGIEALINLAPAYGIARVSSRSAEMRPRFKPDFHAVSYASGESVRLAPAP